MTRNPAFSRWISIITPLALVLTSCPSGDLFAPSIGEIAEIVEDPAGTPVRFSVAADMRSFVGLTEFRGLLDSLTAKGAGEFLVSPGDIDPPDQVYGAIQEKLGSSFPWFPMIGNHEAETPEDMDYLRAFPVETQYSVENFLGGPPGSEETCYSFDFGGAHLVFLNQYYDGFTDIGLDPPPSDPLAGTISPSLLEWLRTDLESANLRAPAFILVFGHEPLWPMADEATGRLRHDGTSLDAHPVEVRSFIALLQEYSVTAYVCGHTHNFSAALVDGVPQIDAGHGRGDADAGAPSTYLLFDLYENMVKISAFRDPGIPDGNYELAREIRLLSRP